jgi:hypothetical protein
MFRSSFNYHNRKNSSSHRSKRKSQRTFEALERRAMMAVVSGDFDNDGLADFVYGRADDAVAFDQGAGKIDVVYGSSAVQSERLRTLSQASPGIQGAVEAGDAFGRSLAVGDFNGDGFDDLAIGVPGEDVGSILGAGAVQIIFGSSNGLTHEGDELLDQNSAGIPGSAETDDNFGNSLAAADFNGDGYDDLAIGVALDDIGKLVGAGAVNIIYGSADGMKSSGNEIWDQDSSGIQGKAEALDGFGDTLTAGDFNGDGYADLAIGVWREDVGSIMDAGAVNILYGSKNGLSSSGNQIWDQDSSGVLGKAERFDEFGSDVQSGDFNGDGYDDLAISVWHEDGAAKDTGAVQILYGGRQGLTAGGNQLWDQDSFGVKGSAEAGDTFGNSLAAGDFNGDGRDDLAIGVPYEDIGKVRDAGAVNVLYGSGSGLTAKGNQMWDQASPGVDGSAEAIDLFGMVATGDLNGDGRDELLVHVYGEDVGSSTNLGGVNIINGSSEGLTGSGSTWWNKNRFEIDVNFQGNGLNINEQTELLLAAQRWSDVIVGDVPDGSIKGRGNVDDLVIDVVAGTIDGTPAGTNTLAQAGVDNFRKSGKLPTLGHITFDSADLPTMAANDLRDLAFHEIGHTLGMGSHWKEMGLISKKLFTGETATAVYNTTFDENAKGVPLSSLNNHWDEETFDNEIMTPDADTNELLSRITIAALADMGYEVDYSARDDYSPPKKRADLVAGNVFEFEPSAT